MPIKVTCQCGQQFAAKDELAGKVAECPKCKKPLKIGAPKAKQPAQSVAPVTPVATGVGDLLDEIGFHVHKEDESIQHCPACDAKISDHAILCVNCGYNLQTGKFAKGVGGSGALAGGKVEGHEGLANMLLKKAETAIHVDKQEEHKIRTQGAPIWMLIVAISIIATLAIGMSVLPRDTAMALSGIVWLGICSLVSLYYWVQLCIIAFSESIAAGIMFLFVPFYNLIYVFTRWDKCGKPFLIQFVVGLLANLGWALLAIAPRLKEEGGPKKDARAWMKSDRTVALAPAWPADASPTAMKHAAQESPDV